MMYGSSKAEMSNRRLSTPKLEEAFQAHGQSGHRFVKKSFTRPTYCHHCTDMLWGFTNQGFICEVCNFVTHERCLTCVITACVSIATTLVKTPVAHTWGGKSFYRRKFCSVCRRRLEDSPSFRCQVCEYFVHDTCKAFSISDCKQTTTFIPSLNKPSILHRHHWREGNMSASTKCVYCKRSCGSMECLASYKCSWCSQAAHSNCYEMLPKECKFGYLHKLTLPPFCVSLPNTDLWGPWRKTKSGSESIQDCSIDEDDGIVPDQPCAVQSTRLPTASLQSLQTEGMTYVDVYDGDLTSPKTCKSIAIPRNAPVEHLLNEALKKFCINDDPNNYYLAKAVDTSNERPLDSQELPVQFPENEERPLVFLRIKNVDRRKGYIRIYSGKQLNVSATFKTIPVTASTTVDEVIQITLQKFGIPEANQQDYVLTEMHLQGGVEERCMENHERPWKCLMDIRKKSIRQMKFTRFYLRRKLEPCCSACLCIGNLPTYLERSRYEAILSDLLKETSEHCEVEYIHPSYGMVFVTLPSADLAADAIEKLKDSVIEGKDVFVKLLPNIHPDMIPHDCHPLLVFVNPKSGGGQGDDILSAFQRLLNPHQVYSLLEGGPLPGLFAFKDVEKFRILICGGDGTVGWILSCLDDINAVLKCRMPPSAVVPLGTGNDLSRVLNWGGGYSSGETPLSLLMAVDHANVGHLDRWFVMFDNADTPLSDTRSNDSAIGMGCTHTDEPNMFIMNNYFGIGIDADLCLDFHLKREEAPEKFTSRLHNKGVYLRAGLRKMTKRSSYELSNEIQLEVDGKHVDLPSLEGIVILNIGSWAAGADVWGPDRDDDFHPSSHCDGMVEVVGLTGIMQMGQIQSGMRFGVRIAQGAQINIKLKSELPVQIDGEPWMQSAGQVIIRPTLNQAAILSKRKVRVKELHQRAATSRPTSAHISNSVFYHH